MGWDGSQMGPWLAVRTAGAGIIAVPMVAAGVKRSSAMLRLYIEGRDESGGACSALCGSDIAVEIWSLGR